MNLVLTVTVIKKKKPFTEGLAEIHSNLDKLRHEFKTETDEVKSSFKDLEHSYNFTQGEVHTLKEKSKVQALDLKSLNRKTA